MLGMDASERVLMHAKVSCCFCQVWGHLVLICSSLSLVLTLEALGKRLCCELRPAVTFESLGPFSGHNNVV